MQFYVSQGLSTNIAPVDRREGNGFQGKLFCSVLLRLEFLLHDFVLLVSLSTVYIHVCVCGCVCVCVCMCGGERESVSVCACAREWVRENVWERMGEKEIVRNWVCVKLFCSTLLRFEWVFHDFVLLVSLGAKHLCMCACVWVWERESASMCVCVCCVWVWGRMCVCAWVCMHVCEVVLQPVAAPWNLFFIILSCSYLLTYIYIYVYVRESKRVRQRESVCVWVCVCVCICVCACMFVKCVWECVCESVHILMCECVCACVCVCVYTIMNIHHGKFKYTCMQRTRIFFFAYTYHAQGGDAP